MQRSDSINSFQRFLHNVNIDLLPRRAVFSRLTTICQSEPCSIVNCNRYGDGIIKIPREYTAGHCFAAFAEKISLSHRRVDVIGQSYGKKVNPTMKLDEMPEDGDQYVGLCIVYAKKLLLYEADLYNSQ